MAAGLVERGFVRRRQARLLAPNVPEYAVAFHATTLAGGAVTTINPVAQRPRRSATSWRRTRRALLVTVPAAAEHAHTAASDTAWSRSSSSARTPLRPSSGAEPLARAGCGRSGRGPRRAALLERHDRLSKGRDVDAPQPCRQPLPGTGDDPAEVAHDVVIGVLPFFHIYGMQSIMNLALRAGATIVTMPRFDLRGFLSLIQEHRATCAFIVPPIALMLAKNRSSTLRPFEPGAPRLRRSAPRRRTTDQRARSGFAAGFPKDTG